jgi:tetratricopeptide (TPR) repeat protein
LLGAKVGSGGGWEHFEKGRIDAPGKALSAGAEGELKRRVLRLVRRGLEVEHFCNSGEAQGADTSLGKERLPAGPASVDVMLEHGGLIWYTARLESLKIIGRPSGELALPDLALAVPRKASASEQFAYAQAIEKEKGPGTHESLAAYRAWALYWPGSLRATAFSSNTEAAGPLCWLRARGAPGQTVELWNRLGSSLSEADAVKYFCHYQVGASHGTLGRGEEALMHLRLGRDVHPAYGLAIGGTFLLFGECDEAIREWEYCAAKFPGTMDEVKLARFQLGFAWHRKGDREKAIAAFRDYLDKCPGHYFNDRARRSIADIEAVAKSKR